MKALILDIATKTGWSSIRDGSVLSYGLLRLDKGVSAKSDFNRHPAILLNANREFGQLFIEHQPDFIVAEIPHLRGASSFLTVALYGMAQLTAAKANVGFYGVRTSEWQSRIILGPSKPKGATKQRSVAWAKSHGFTPETDDVADALCIAEYVNRYLQLSDGSMLERSLDLLYTTVTPTITPVRPTAISDCRTPHDVAGACDIGISKTTEGQAAAGVGIGTAGAVISEAAGQLAPLADYSEVLNWLFIGLLVASIGITLWTTLRNARTAEVA